MKSFTDRVKRDQEKHEGLHVIKVVRDVDPREREPIDLIAMDRNGKVTFIRARGNGHGNINAATRLRLQLLGKQCNAKILHAKENGSGEIVYTRIYGYERVYERK